jgi:hypothetical protein
VGVAEEHVHLLAIDPALQVLQFAGSVRDQAGIGLGGDQLQQVPRLRCVTLEGSQLVQSSPE